MLLPNGLSSYSFAYDNWGANPATTNMGLSVVPGASNVEGAWTQIATSGNIAQDCYWLQISVNSGNSASNDKSHLLDIGVDPAGGTSYVAVISNIVCGNSSTMSGRGLALLFPYFIKAGSSVAVRMQGSNATAGTVRVLIKFHGQPSNPEAVPIGMFSETIGTITNSGGVSFTPGNAADGTWVSLGTTAKAMWWWQLCFQVSNAAQASEATYIDLAHGDATNKRIIMRAVQLGSSTESSNGDYLTQNLMMPAAYCPVPAGGELWVRGRCNNAPDTGYNAVAVGIGG